MNPGFGLGDQLIEFVLRFNIQLDDSIDIVRRITDAGDCRDRTNAARITFAGAGIGAAAPAFGINRLFAVEIQDGPLASCHDGGLTVGTSDSSAPQNIFADDVLTRQFGRVFDHSDHDGYLTSK
jgi:hypothetical protein